MFELLESFCKQIVPPLTEHDDVIDTQTKNCMHTQIAHGCYATALSYRNLAVGEK